jgi:hypothetical protein
MSTLAIPMEKLLESLIQQRRELEFVKKQLAGLNRQLVPPSQAYYLPAPGSGRRDEISYADPVSYPLDDYEPEYKAPPKVKPFTD